MSEATVSRRVTERPAATPKRAGSTGGFSDTRPAPAENGGFTAVPGIVALILIFGIFAILEPSMTYAFTIQNILLEMGSYGFVALGVVLILIVGEIDLSVGSIAGLGSAIVGTLIEANHYPWVLAVAIGIVAGLAIGALQGVLVTKLRVPSFVITLGGLLSWQGVQLAVLHDTTLNVTSTALEAFGSGVVTAPVSWALAAVVVILFALPRFNRRRNSRNGGRIPRRDVVQIVAVFVVVGGGVVVLTRGTGVPLVLWIYLTLVAAMGFVLQRTRMGRGVYAVGGNTEAARRAGFSPDFVRIVVFSLSGGFAAIGGIYITGRGGTADTLTGSGSLVLVSIAAAIIGGCSLFGGRGSPWAAIVGAAVLATLIEGLNIANQGADTQLILEGSILVVAVAVDAIMRRRSAETSHSEQ